MSRLTEIFQENHRCFIPFVTAGHPDLEATRQIILKLAEAGAHIIEIGIPFSDPIADGPVIQKSSYEALKQGHNMADYLELVKRLRQDTEVGLIFMTYMNPVLSYGYSRLDREAREVGLDGILISDLTPEEYLRLDRFTLDTIFLAAPTSSEERLRKIAQVARGFVYLVARTGVTGKPSEVAQTVPQSVKRLRRFTDLPIAVGFGITDSEDVKKVWQHAEGAVIGSAIVKFIESNRSSPDLPTLVAKYVTENLLPPNPS